MSKKVPKVRFTDSAVLKLRNKPSANRKARRQLAAQAKRVKS